MEDLAQAAGDILPPELLRSEHPIDAFSSREEELNMWLARKALHNARHGFSRTYVVCNLDKTKVVGYYCLASGSVQRVAAVKKMQRNAPDPIPVMIIGRLAVDRAWERRGVGAGLLRDAVLRTFRAGQIAGIAALLTHCMSEEAKAFYLREGFKPSPLNPLTMILSMNDIERALDRLDPVACRNENRTGRN